MIPPPHDDDDALAAEYVLGVLDLPDRLAAESRIRTEAAFAARVAGWEQRLAPLNDDYPEAPAPDLMPALEARLFPQAPVRRAWFGWLSGLAAAAVVAGAVVFFRPEPVLDVAMLVNEEHGITYMVQHKGEMLMVSRMKGDAAPAGQVHELWIIPPGGAPQSLGLLGDMPMEMPYPMPPKGWTLAVSMEPVGGSPTGQPTGPVLMSATVSA